MSEFTVKMADNMESLEKMLVEAYNAGYLDGKSGHYPYYELDQQGISEENQLRKELIESAKNTVDKIEDVLLEGLDFEFEHEDSGVQARTTITEYEFNSRDRTVTALIRGAKNPVLYAKGVAKCPIEQVYNEDIGKLISLHKALGIAVPQDFKYPVQPSRKIYGMVLMTDIKEKRILASKEEYMMSNSTDICTVGSYNEKYSIIIEDTNAKY